MDEEIFHDIILQVMYKVYVHPVTLKLVFSETIKLDEYDRCCEYRKKDYNRFKKRIDKDGWDAVLFRGITKLFGTAIHPETKENIELKIPDSEFKLQMKNKDGISLKQYTELVYRFKWYKYDYFNEGFNLKYKIHKNTMKLEVEFYRM